MADSKRFKSPKPDLGLEAALWAEGRLQVCGVDEAGRGPLAGPVVSAAVVFPPHSDLEKMGLSGLNDSKKLSPGVRAVLDGVIRVQALAVGVGVVSPQEIDRINIRQAALLSMSQAISLVPVPDYVLVDGRDWPEGLALPGEAIVRGDGRSATIAAASVVAKVHRDKIMACLAEQYPAYGWERNRGYPTKEHLKALQKEGVTEQHRLSFAPVARVLSLSR